MNANDLTKILETLNDEQTEAVLELMLMTRRFARDEQALEFNSKVSRAHQMPAITHSIATKRVESMRPVLRGIEEDLTRYVMKAQG